MKQSIALTELMRCLDEFAPFALASDWDNSGLQIGDFSVPITGILCGLHGGRGTGGSGKAL